MPTNVKPIEPPKVTPAYERPSLPIEAWGAPNENKVMPAPPPAPDVSSWVDKANKRLEPAWQENELRGGRLFQMPGASADEARELSDIFRQAWDVGMFRHDGVLCLTFKPRRETKVRR